MSAHIQVQFGKTLRRFRAKRKLSQEKLAELADLHINSIGRIERAQLDPSLTTVGKIAKALKVKPRDLFENVT